ncbi:probable NADH dehydrogenase [ubiquinone] 1 alpha subcomplex subunit 5, mitochondrial [Rhododendron vialii]|uniref:probable NADH dehydrogenase [ubiquinone] 1 alpha subcomplex subunit 5, mitochondrial n=1 Tax=Rhododendron vialii TaxID=182163 RepID=UPI00265EE24A|nr:probable NADH dehydrogenase [ubiquinone] 1 alpha subcomplex subunit 5, mitochondrial [Rhododendron vialii]
MDQVDPRIDGPKSKLQNGPTIGRPSLISLTIHSDQMQQKCYRRTDVETPESRLECEREGEKMFVRMVARPLMVKVKETTGIVGLEVVPNAREVLISLYGKTLKEIQTVPEDEGYRKAVESFTRHRLKVCQEEQDWETIEKRLGCGQVEELIEEAQDELQLIAKMIEWDPWGVPDDYECEVIEDDAPVPKHIPLHRPGPLPEEFYKTLESVTTGMLQDMIALSKKDGPAITSGGLLPKV